MRNIEILDLLNKLLDWNKHMGGFDAPVWIELREQRDRINTIARVQITLEGGVVQDIYADQAGVEVVIKDYDIEGHHEDEALPVDVDGNEYAYSRERATVAPRIVAQTFLELSRAQAIDAAFAFEVTLLGHAGGSDKTTDRVLLVMAEDIESVKAVVGDLPVSEIEVKARKGMNYVLPFDSDELAGRIKESAYG